MSINAEPLSWDELPDMMSIEQARRFMRMGERQMRKFARKNGIYGKYCNSVRIPKAGLAIAINENIEINIEDFTKTGLNEFDENQSDQMRFKSEENDNVKRQ